MIPVLCGYRELQAGLFGTLIRDSMSETVAALWECEVV